MSFSTWTHWPDTEVLLRKETGDFPQNLNVEHVAKRTRSRFVS